MLRLFLSVDIEGSTHLKNILNHTALSRDFNKWYDVINKYLEITGTLGSSGDIDKNSIWLSAKKVLSNIYDSHTDDWAIVCASTFESFNDLFYSQIDKKDPNLFRQTPLHPWKALGDELIYSFEVRNRKEINILTSSFLSALRQVDKDLFTKSKIRVKGTGWVAGFPIRNRIIIFPFPELHRKREVEGSVYDPFQYPREDYCGPEMDIGFRLGKATSPGFLVCSIELLILLGECDTKEQLRCAHVGWDKLKGVWDGQPYPIYFLYPSRDEELTSYTEYYPGLVHDSPFIKKWEENKSKLTKVESLVPNARAIIKFLPESLGVIEPYIESESMDDYTKMPDNHKLILELLKLLVDSKVGLAEPENVIPDPKASAEALNKLEL